MAPQSVLIVGGSGGLGSALVRHYASTIDPTNVYATTRSTSTSPDQFPSGVKVITGVDCSREDVGSRIEEGLQGAAVQVVVYVAGVLKPEEFGKSNWDDQVMMYKICSIAPVCQCHPCPLPTCQSTPIQSTY